MKSTVYIFFIVFSCTIFSCKKDDARSCTTCTSAQTSSFEVCKEPDGTASVNGEDTETNYTIYISRLEADGVSCGG